MTTPPPTCTATVDAPHIGAYPATCHNPAGHYRHDNPDTWHWDGTQRWSDDATGAHPAAEAVDV